MPRGGTKKTARGRRRKGGKNLKRALKCTKEEYEKRDVSKNEKRGCGK